ncbi:encodes MtrR protein [Xenorhabdus mauleonii]|uniref:Encodes MtrR protein n=1 Tax=Xenorhabdus mauleonii TaxID=351675 RepID=A0A1I3I2F8_9GAMM|nr:TetR/AcrR family transcriptional regulator [Xenorhabdus mauleonii]PHM40176.1 encodes MtrR protein [Xenorhabdus mauleonii]SFI42136.1 transcriptional regulator, TetR family [Xenorhabdus mauleonii]
MSNKLSSKQKLIEAMGELLLEKGLANTSPKDILTRSGVGQGSLYHHFQGKEELAFYAIRYNTNQFISSSEAILNTDKSAYEKLALILHKERNIERGCLIGQMARDRRIMEDPKLGEEVTRGFNWMKQSIEELVRISISDGSISNTLAPLETTTLILSTLQGAYITAKGLQDDTYFHISINALLKALK